MSEYRFPPLLIKSAAGRGCACHGVQDDNDGDGSSVVVLKERPAMATPSITREINGIRVTHTPSTLDEGWATSLLMRQPACEVMLGPALPDAKLVRILFRVQQKLMMADVPSDDFPRSNCKWENVGASKACIFPTPAYPNDATAVGFTACQLRQLTIAFIRAYRIAVWARQYLYGIMTCPSPWLRIKLWNSGHLWNPVVNDFEPWTAPQSSPSAWFGPYAQSRFNIVLGRLNLLVNRFLNASIKFHSVGTGKPIPTTDRTCDGVAKAAYSSGNVYLCQSLFSGWGEGLGEPGRTNLSRLLVHELMHGLSSGLDDKVHPKYGQKAYENIALLLVTDKYYDVAVSNIDNYTMWMIELFRSVEASCLLFSSPVGGDESNTYFYLGKPPWWEVKKT